MKKRVMLFISLCAMCFFLPTHIFSAEFYLSPIVEYKNALLGEYVLFSEIFPETEQNYVLSDLQWYTNLIFDLGLNAECKTRWFSFLGQVNVAIPMNAGFMTDEDYFLFDMIKYDYSGEKPEYIYSRSQTHLDFFYAFLFGFAWNKPLSSRDTFFLLGADFEFRSMQLTTHDGIQYVYEHNGTQESMGEYGLLGEGITYKQNLFFLWLNMSFALPLSQKMNATFDFSYSPLWHGRGYDRHHMRSLDFLDMVTSFVTYKLAGTVIWELTKKSDLGVKLLYLYVPKTTGISSMKNFNEILYTRTSGLGGMSLSEFSASVFYRYRFTK